MSKIALVFPGQGTQTVGMGKDFYDSFDSVKDIYKLASEVSGLDIEKICFTENEDINVTEFTQIALLTTEIAVLEAIKSKGIEACVTAGLSLGEYAALYATGAIELKDVLSLIRKRGIYMQNAYPTGGAMMAILGLDADIIGSVLSKVEGIVSIANDNCPGQVVISGEEKAVAEAGEKLAEAGAKRCVPLNVSGPFHSLLLKSAGEKLAVDLEGIELHDIAVPYICNVEARPVSDKSEVKELLVRQVYSGVRFRESIDVMLSMGVDTFIEVGPGKTLAGFIKKSNREAKVINIQNVTDLDKLDELVSEV